MATTNGNGEIVSGSKVKVINSDKTISVMIFDVGEMYKGKAKLYYRNIYIMTISTKNLIPL